MQRMNEQRQAGTALSVVPGAGLEGYSAQPSYRAGDRGALMASGCGGPAGFEVVRLVHGDPSPAGPGYVAEPQDWGQPAELELEPRSLDMGSFVRIPYHDALTPAGDFTVAVWALPTHFREGWHALAAMWSPGRLAYGLFVAGSNSIQAAVSLDGRRPLWAQARGGRRLAVVPGAVERQRVARDRSGNLDFDLSSYCYPDGRERAE